MVYPTMSGGNEVVSDWASVSGADAYATLSGKLSIGSLEIEPSGDRCRVSSNWKAADSKFSVAQLRMN